MATRPVPVPVPTPTPPKPAPKPAPAKQTSTAQTSIYTQPVRSSTPNIPSSSVPTGGGYQNGGWYPVGPNGQAMQYWNGSWSSAPQGQQSGGGDSGFQMPDINFDEIYAPQFQALDAAVNTANENFGLAQGDVARAKESQLRDVQAEQDKAQGYFEEGNQRATRNKQSAYGDAVRYYNAMQQQAKARFGRGNSAGQAVGELAQAEFFRNQGNIEQSYADIYKELEGKWQDALKTYSITKLKIDEWAETQISSLKKELNNQLANIQMARAQTESDKTARRMEVLNRAREQTNAIALATKQRLEGIEAWKEQQRFLIANKLVPIYNQPLNTQGAQATTSTLSAPTQTQGNSSIISTLRWNPNTKSFVDDENKPLGGLSYTA